MNEILTLIFQKGTPLYMNERNFQTNLRNFLSRTISWIETIISLILIITTIALTVHLTMSILHYDPSQIGEGTMSTLLLHCFELIIALEFVRMLSKHSAASIIEIILFSIARSMIAEHQNPTETVLLIIALLLLMIIRKYFLLPGDFENDPDA